MNATKTFSPRPRDIERRWYLIDADGAVLGRLASEVAKILRGKHKPIFAPHADTGDHVIVVNARGVRVTGGKENQKTFYHHSGYPGGLREVGYATLLAKRPSLAVEKAVKGMLPKNRLGRQMATKLQVYEGAEHPHRAQQPKPLALGEIPAWEGLPQPKPKPNPEPAPKPAREEKTVKATARKSTARASSTRRAATTRGASSRPARSRQTPAAGETPAEEKTPAGADAATTEQKPSRVRRRRSAKKES